ncbi:MULTISPECIES: non-ribosomal peptide synthetase [unclassified Streptomyces]|uniref:non-ribosomal peptide synthetase n=1 Tax=Streptomyces TaxID=1883 RepID=UPI000F7459C3|nr:MULTISPECIES: non-ribosomal peptide synthetase [unclassified Streptomyces]QNE28701.1 amino acid adenylation domain-containing protein [Streptomyces sp. INR7]RST10016.1 amino acid adenylation domain-containing protein [Streptomyces sp. WAC05950]
MTELLPARADSAASFPMTETQQALMIGRGEAVEMGGIGCYGYFEWERADLDPERFADAWRKVVARHDMLRAIGGTDGTQWVPSDPLPFDIPVVDLTGLSPDAAREHLAALREEMSHVVFPVGSWPLFDLRIIRLGGPENLGRVHLGIDLQVLDASSAFQVLFPELVDLYEDPDAELPEPGIGFAEYARWRADALPHTEAFRAARDYWVQRVPTLPPAPSLPTGGSAGDTGEVRFDRREHRLSPADWRRFTERAHGAGLTPSVLLTAAFAEVVRAWAEESDFTINYPVFQRPPVHPDITGVLGDFTNAVMLAADGSGATFLDRAHALRDQLARDVEHGSFNGVRVLRELTRLHGVGAQAGMPVVVTSLLDYPVRRPVTDLGREVYSISQTPQVTLDVQLRELAGELRVIWDFVDGAFAPGFVDAAFGVYVDLLARLTDDPDSLHTARFDLIPPAERELRRQVNDTSGQIPYTTLHELFARQAELTPDAEAVVDSGRRLSYAELAAYAWRIGHTLREHGAAPGELVAVVMEKGWEQYAAVYGILAAGAAYLPLDASVPPERLRRLLAEAKVDRILTQSSLDSRISWPPTARRYRVDKDFETGAATRPDTAQTPADLAYTIFTSGSTGEPKGVMVDHIGVVNLIRDVAERFEVGARDRLLAISGLHFDASIYDVFGVLTQGGTVVVPPPFEHAEPDVWADLVQAERVTLWNSVPVLMELLVGEAEVRERRGGGRPLESLRLSVLSGDWIPLTLPDRLRAQSPRIQVVGSGGPTETICWSLFQPIGEVDPSWTSIPYGKPITNQRYYIVDGASYERPLGVVGEMAVASDVGLALGYWNDAERTASRFVRLPETGERAYLTGDLGRYLPDGSIEILGRDDFQVKIQGHRIELGEIEAVLRQDAEVEAAVVVAPSSAHGVRRLHAFVVAGPGSDAGAADRVLERLAAQLPGYMVPAAITALDELPLTRNGKVDRLLLASSAGSRQSADDAAVRDAGDGPGSALELVLCAAVADILGLDGVAPGDNFFTLGGDSLSGTRLAGLLGELLGVPVPVKTVFQTPVVRELAEKIAADEQHGAEAVAAAEAFGELEDDGTDTDGANG